MSHLRDRFHRHHERCGCEEALALAVATIDYLAGLLEAAGVDQYHASVTINDKEHTTMFVGSTATATVTYDDADGNKIDPPAGTVAAFSTSDAAVATVDPTSGLVTAVAAGTVTIGCHSDFPDGTAQDAAAATVSVETPDPASSTVTVA